VPPSRSTTFTPVRPPGPATSWAGPIAVIVPPLTRTQVPSGRNMRPSNTAPFLAIVITGICERAPQPCTCGAHPGGAAPD
jgi:hypothetical protein